MEVSASPLVFLMSVICSVSVYAEDKTAQDRATAEVLSRVAAGAREAYERIIFVKGEYVVEEQRFVSPRNVPGTLRELAQGGAAHSHSEAVMRFSFDRRTHRVAQELRQTKFPTLVSLAKGEEIGTIPELFHHRFLISPDGFYQMDVGHDDFGPVEGFSDVKGLESNRGLLAVVEPAKTATRYMSVCFDPDYWFSMDVLMFHVAYQRWAEILQSGMPAKSYKGFSEILSTDATEQDSKGVVLIKEFRTGKYADSGGDVTIVTTHSSAHSFLPVAYEHRIGDVVVREKAWKWKQYEGVYLPEEYFERVCTPGDGTLGWSLNMHYKDAAINGEIGDEFDIAVALGLSTGNRIHDTVKGTLGVVNRSGDIVDVEQYNAAYIDSTIGFSTSLDESVRSRRWLLWLNLPVLLCVFVYSISRYLNKNTRV